MNRTKTFRMLLGIALVTLLVLGAFPVVTALKQTDAPTPVYVIHKVSDSATRSAIAATGANIIEVGKDYVLVEATRKERSRSRPLV